MQLSNYVKKIYIYIYIDMYANPRRNYLFDLFGHRQHQESLSHMRLKMGICYSTTIIHTFF